MQHRYVTCTSTALCSGNSLLHACKYIMHLSCKNYQAYYFEYFGKKKKNFLYMFTKLTYHSKIYPVQQNSNEKKKIYIITNHLYNNPA